MAALVGLLAVTAGWWALALWPAGGSPPGWLARTREVCFGTAADGLPDAGGWAALIGQPVVMLAILLAGWRRELADGLRRLAARPAPRAALAGLGLAVAGGAAFGVHVVREAAAREAEAAEALAPRAEAASSLDPAEALGLPSRLEGPAPPLRLVDQHGRETDLGRFRGGVVLVTFAFANCETVCPAIVRDVLSAAAELRAAGRAAAAVVVTLDPWRDTPARLPSLAERWGLGGPDVVLSGPVEEVERVLDAWRVPRSRSARNGDLVHPRLAYVVGPDGRVVHTANGGAAVLTALAARL